MNWENLRDQLKERLNGIFERIKDTDLYIQMRERYQNATPLMQKLVLTSGFLFITLIILVMPYSFYSASSETTESFENNVNLVRDLYRVQRDLAGAPMVPNPPNPTEVKNQVTVLLSQQNLAPEQIGPVKEITPDRDSINALQPEGILEGGVEVVLFSLNLKQVVDIGTNLSQLKQGLHMTSVDMKANAQNDHYYDVIFRISGFSVAGGVEGSSPPVQAPPPPPDNGTPTKAIPPASPKARPGRSAS